jgi:hypothetical protein
MVMTILGRDCGIAVVQLRHTHRESVELEKGEDAEEAARCADA